jgi:Transglycosylase SLT domain
MVGAWAGIGRIREGRMTLAGRVILSSFVVAGILTFALELRRGNNRPGPTTPDQVSVSARHTDGAAPRDASTPENLADLSNVVSTAATKFAYRIIHTASPLPKDVVVRLSFADDGLETADQAGALTDLDIARPTRFSRTELCSYAATVARANDLPVPFFANLIWHESNFNIKVVSRVGAQGIAQFMPGTAVQFGLLNPFDPVHALSAAGSFLRRLYRSFGNLGLAAAAYNAGPQRVRDWMANRGPMPEETRNYVLRITSRSVEEWSQMKAGGADILMPPSAPCPEVLEGLREQWAAMQITEREFADAPIQLAHGNPSPKRPRSKPQKLRERR